MSVNIEAKDMNNSLSLSLSAELAEKVNKSIEILKLGSKMSQHYYNQPLIITYSGGKDSEVLVDLAFKSGIEFEIWNNHTTVDAPETVYHIREQFKRWREMGIRCHIQYPEIKGERISMWSLIPRMGIMPSMWVRYCCKVLKEANIKKRMFATGVRKSESSKRQNRTALEYVASKKDNAIRKTFEEASEVFQEDIDNNPYGECRFITAAKRNRKLVVNPIIDWTDDDVWKYIHAANLKYNPLYDEGFKRVGCVGCILSGKKCMEKDFERYPKYEKLYRQTCQKLYEKCMAEGKPFYLDKERTIAAKNGDEIFDWWINLRK